MRHRQGCAILFFDLGGLQTRCTLNSFTCLITSSVSPDPNPVTQGYSPLYSPKIPLLATPGNKKKTAFSIVYLAHGPNKAHANPFWFEIVYVDLLREALGSFKKSFYPPPLLVAEPLKKELFCGFHNCIQILPVEKH